MYKIILKSFFLLLIMTGSTSSKSESLIKKNSLTGNWMGSYSWKCSKGGKKEFKLSIIDKKGKLSGQIHFLDKTFQIEGKRMENAELGEWQYIKGKDTKKGKDIVLKILDPKNKNISLNVFSGQLNKNEISGIVMNGDKCSSYKGPSGVFSIKKTK